jgi:hypothetical protein
VQHPMVSWVGCQSEDKTTAIRMQWHHASNFKAEVLSSTESRTLISILLIEHAPKLREVLYRHVHVLVCTSYRYKLQVGRWYTNYYSDVVLHCQALWMIRYKFRS